MAFDPEDEDEQRRREAMTTVNRRKLLEHQKVEVRSCTDEGFLGSWHSGTVIATESSARWVQYDHLLLDEYSSTKLVERIEVPSIVDGIEINNKSMSNYRGWIRPLSPPCYFSIWFLHYGQCVDVYYSDAWWEGVILDHQDGSAERNVFFPDIGDEMAAHKDNLRISQDWDEQTELWKPRGNWIFLELIEEIEKDWPILVSVKQIWYDVRARSGFDNLKEWTSCLTDIWRELLLEVIVDNIKLFLKDFFPTLSSSSSGNTLHDCGHLMELSGPILDAVLKNKECFVDSLAVVPGSNGFLNRSEFLHVDEKGEYRQPCDEINRDKLATVTTFDRLGKMPLSSSVKTIDEEIACASSRTMAIAPSMTGEVSKVNSCTNHEESFNASLEVSKITKNNVWHPAGPNIVSDPDYCPEAVDEYCRLFKSGNKRYLKVQNNVWKHLLFMGWKIEYRNNERINGMQQLRYIEPGSPEKYFVSLVDVCEYLKAGASKELCSFTDLKIPKEKAQDNWVPFCLPEPEFYEDAVTEYINISKCGRQPSEEHILNVLKHLSFLGWKVEYTKETWRYRFIMPKDGGSEKEFRSLFEVCQYMETSSSDIVSMFPQDVQNCLSYAADATLFPTEHSQERKSVLIGPSPDEELIFEPEYCPQAVMNYHTHVTKEKGDHSKWKTGSMLKDMQLKVKKHLFAVGWKLYHYRTKKKLRYRYISPSRKMYDSLRSACKGYIDEEIHVGKLAEVQLPREARYSPSASEEVRKEIHCENKKKRKSSSLHLASLSSNSVTKENKSKKIQAIKSKDNINRPVSVSDRVLRSSKRAREVVDASSSHRNPCTILSWLMDNQVVLPSEKVQYRIGKDCKMMAEGRVTRDGIKCNCCQETFTLHNFEVHANSTCHQPSANIFLENGRSLLECQLQLRRDLNTRGSNRGRLEISVGLQTLLGKPVQLGRDHMTWTLLKYIKPDKHYHNQSDIVDSTEIYSKLNIALGVMHECFEPLNEPRTRRDLVEDVIFNRRVHGEKVAEIPLVATRSHYRRRGMCHVLMDELEKVLVKLGVERLVLPAIPSMLNTWISSFGFSRMSPSERLELLDYTFLSFKGTTMCQKLLLMTPRIKSNPPSLVKQHSDVISGDDIEGSSGGSEILQTERVDDNGAVGQTCINLGGGVGGEDKSCSDYWVSQPTGFEYVPCQNGEMGLQSSGKGSD
ncbi:hypothetical protein ACET3Z_007439 [Daucus carota]